MKKEGINYQQANAQARMMVESGLSKADATRILGVSYRTMLVWTAGISATKRHYAEGLKMLARGLDRITGKPHDGAIIPEWYRSREYGRITDYIEKEGDEFVKFCAWLYGKMPGLLKGFKEADELKSAIK